jgi:hypothetical protein
MALSKLQYNSLNVTPSASKGIRFNSGANGFEAASAGGNLTLIKTTTLASAAATIDFVNGASDVVLDSTYKEYIFYLNDIHPATGAAKFRIIGSTDTGSNYGVATTSTMFEAMQDEAGGNETVRYEDGDDAAQSTSAINISTGVGSDADECLSGYLHLFEPSSTTFVKHFISSMQFVNNSGTPYCKNNFSAGYINTTSAVDAIQFSFSSGNIDAGIILMYGVK